MREIKFRAWHLKLNKMFYDCSVSSNGTWIDSSSHYGGENDTVMQYTGLKDKNRKEIYEGDILFENPDGVDVVGVVTFKDGGLAVDYRQRNTQKNLGRYNIAERKKYYKVEIIGNIYENPELLK